MFIKFSQYLWIGGSGDDLYVSDGLKDWYYGNDGDDVVVGDDSIDFLFGGDDDDQLYGGGGNDQMFGGADDDILVGGAGADTMDGGSGSDTASYYGATIGVTVNLATGQGAGGDAQGDVLISVENVEGGEGNDNLTGTAGDNSIWGQGGNDVINAGNGHDWISGGANTGPNNGVGDYLTGGGGNDIFEFFQPGDSGGGVSRDVITDFGNGDDVMRFHANSYANVWAPLTFSGETTGFQGSGNEAWFETYFNPGLGVVTEVHVRIDGIGRSDTYYDVLLLGDVEVTASDILI